MLSEARSGYKRAALDSALALLAEHFQATGARLLDLPFLYPSEELLDLYGEDLRARAFVYGDAERGDEVCLRPDFTVPVALAHRELGWDQVASYAYHGTVFRRQPTKLERPVEYMQAGMECFGERDIASADAKMFLTLISALGELGVRETVATLGDLSIVVAVLDALDMPEHRRSALKRHLWRPKRFQELIARACKVPDTSEMEHLTQSSDPAQQLRTIDDAVDIVGLRSVRDVQDRLDLLAEQLNAPAMPSADAQLISDVLSIRGRADDTATHLRSLTEGAGVDIDIALSRFEERLSLITNASEQHCELQFDASFGRMLEYYDGFVFEFRLAGAALHPPLAGGGRYDAMTMRLGANQEVPAIGGIIRPEAVLKVLS